MFQRALCFTKIILVFVFLTGEIYAAVDADNSIDSFNYISDLTSSNSSLRRVEFNDEIIKQLQHRNAGDIRVFDANGSEMPAMVRVALQGTREQINDLTFYPLYSASGLGDEENIEFNHDLEGNIVSIKSQRKLIDTDSEITGYIIDQSRGRSMTLSSLSFKWQQDSYMQVVNVNIESSDDLKNWRKLHDSVVIAKLQFEGNLLSHDKVTLNSKVNKFIRISLLKPVDGFKLENVTGIYNQASEVDYHWLSLGEMKKMDGEPRAYSFSSESGVAPVKMKFNMKGRNALYSGNLYSEVGENRAERKHNISQYNIIQNGVTIKSDLIELRGITDKNWIFISDTAVSANTYMPEILFAYRKHELVFNAQGKEPYTLAWGNPKLGQQKRSNLPLIIRLAEERGNNVELVGMLKSRKNNTVLAEDEIDWKRYVLWAVLLLGVIGAGVMAYNLFREVSQSKGNGE